MAQKILRRLGAGSLIPSVIVIEVQFAGMAHAGHADTVGRSQQDSHRFGSMVGVTIGFQGNDLEVGIALQVFMVWKQPAI
ncbi:hypothetical protein D3C76_1687650 [compost metagenome]